MARTEIADLDVCRDIFKFIRPEIIGLIHGKVPGIDSKR